MAAGLARGNPDESRWVEFQVPPVPMICETTSLLRLVSGRGGFDG